MDNDKKPLIAVISPIIIVGIMTGIAFIIKPISGQWVWVILEICYWSILLITIIYIAGKKVFKTIFNRTEGRWYWALLAIIVGFIGIDFAVQNIHFYKKIQFIIAMILYVMLNPLMEELYSVVH